MNTERASPRYAGIELWSQAEILDAMRFIWERVKIVIEPSAAVAVAPLLTGKVDTGGLRVGVILSGGNVDLETFFRELASKPV